MGKKSSGMKSPTKALSGYMFFMNDQRPALMEQAKKAFGDGGGKEGNMKRMSWIGKQASEKWAKADAATKAKFEEMAKEDKKRFATEMAAFEKDHGEDLKKAKEEKSAKRKAKKDKLFKGTAGLQIRGSKFQSSSSNSRELELSNFRARSRLYRSQN